MPLKWDPCQVRYPDLERVAESAWEEALTPTDRARAALREGTHIPTPTASARRTGWRQITVRIPDDSYEDLGVAARLLGSKPAQLARMFVLNGTRRALADQDAPPSKSPG